MQLSRRQLDFDNRLMHGFMRGRENRACVYKWKRIFTSSINTALDTSQTLVLVQSLPSSVTSTMSSVLLQDMSNYFLMATEPLPLHECIAMEGEHQLSDNL